MVTVSTETGLKLTLPRSFTQKSFSIDSLTPDQIERIEILRAPTAETGARAIAGTINIITREGYTRRVNDVRLNAAYENGKLNPSATWSRRLFSEIKAFSTLV